MGGLLNSALFALVIAFSYNSFAVSIMAYNAENLFDTKHDVGTEDYTWLPLALKKQMPQHAAYCASMSDGPYKNDCLNVDWTYAHYRRKLSNLADVIRSYDFSSRGPDILVMEEIENLNVLRDLVYFELNGLGYRQAVLIEGDDSRGIDVGLISKFPIVAARRHSVYFEGKKLDTRGILEVVMNVYGRKVVVFANHWPSQNNPAAERVAHAAMLSQLAGAQVADLIVAVGDFNTVSKDNPHPFSFLYGMVDAEERARKLGLPLNPGTHFYKKEWTSLDKIFVHRNSRVVIDWRDFEILMRPWMLGTDGGPKRFNRETGEGYSDHLPIALRVNLNPYWYSNKR